MSLTRLALVGMQTHDTQAFNDLVKKATGGLLLQHIVPKKADGSNLYGMIAGVPAPSTPAPAAPGVAGALVTSDVAARAKAAAAALGLLHLLPCPFSNSCCNSRCNSCCNSLQAGEVVTAAPRGSFFSLTAFMHGHGMGPLIMCMHAHHVGH